MLVSVHGLRDHSDRYTDFAVALVTRGYAVYAFDLPGHGRSAGRRVTIGAFADYVADLERFVASVRAREPGRPLFALGHSMGGVIVALFAEASEAGPGGPTGVILSAPAIRIDTLPLAAAAARLAAWLAPNFGALAPDNGGFSTDPAVEAAMEGDPLIYQLPPAPRRSRSVSANERPGWYAGEARDGSQSFRADPRDGCWNFHGDRGPVAASALA